MGCFSSKNHSREGAEEAYEEPIITKNSDTIVTAIAESQLNNDEVENTPLEPQVPIAATTNPSVTSSITQAEQYQSPERRETVTSRSGVLTVSDDEKKKSVMIAPAAASTPKLLTVTSSFTLIRRLESVNDDATRLKVQESAGKPQGPTASPNEIECMEPPKHESPLQEYTEATEATLCTQANSEEELPSSSDTPPFSYQGGAVPETIRLEDVECRDGDHDFVVMSLKNHRQN